MRLLRWNIFHFLFFLVLTVTRIHGSDDIDPWLGEGSNRKFRFVFIPISGKC